MHSADRKVQKTALCHMSSFTVVAVADYANQIMSNESCCLGKQCSTFTKKKKKTYHLSLLQKLFSNTKQDLTLHYNGITIISIKKDAKTIGTALEMMQKTVSTVRLFFLCY